MSILVLIGLLVLPVIAGLRFEAVFASAGKNMSGPARRQILIRPGRMRSKNAE